MYDDIIVTVKQMALSFGGLFWDSVKPTWTNYIISHKHKTYYFFFEYILSGLVEDILK